MAWGSGILDSGALLFPWHRAELFFFLLRTGLMSSVSTGTSWHMDELGMGCIAHPGQDLQSSSPCTTQGQSPSDTAAQLPVSTHNFNLPNLIILPVEVSPSGLCPGVTQGAGSPQPRGG